MHIKKLEITGFKSFVDRTVVHFDHDMIGIVGPNGCGKSNIVDAIRWCMGEQSAKHLRGRAMEDVIFNGSDSRPQAGLAEVTLTFENGDAEYAATLPETYRNYAEIAVTRRLFRDGTSEYLINKTSVRLRDVTELFLGTGVGTKAYSIVEQGRIGQIVSSRPQDRRLYIEEAAGITKYKQRRRLAERKMEQTRQNLLRITDIVSEIDRTRSSLKRQAAKADRFVRYRSELEDLFLHDASHRLLEMIVSRRVTASALDDFLTRSEDAKQSLEDQEEALERARAEAQQIEDRATTATQKAHEADARVSSLKAEYERAQDRRVHLEERIASGELEQQEIASRLAGLREEQGKLDESISAFCHEEATLTASANDEDGTLAELQSAEMAAVAEVHGIRNESSQVNSELAAARARREALATRLQEAQQRRERLDAERSSLAGEAASLEGNLRGLKEAVEKAVREKHATGDRSSQIEVDLAELKPRAAAARRDADRLAQDLANRRSRLQALEDLHRRLEGVDAATKRLLSCGDPAVRGMVADHVDVSEELSVAFAAVLGDRLQAVVVEAPDEALRLLDQLRDGTAGRAAIATRTPFTRSTPIATEAQADCRVVGRLLDGLRVADENVELLRALVGDTLVVRTAKDALDLVSAYPQVTAVALDGTVVGPDGVLRGGSGETIATAILDQKREIAQLRDAVRDLEQKAEEQAAKHAEIEAEIAEKTTLLSEASRNAHQAELEFLTAEKDLARVESDLERTTRRTDQVSQDLDELNAKSVDNSAEQHACSESIASLEGRLEVIAGRLAEGERAASEWKQKAASQASRVTERRVHLARVREQLGSARASTERVQSTMTDLKNRTGRLESELLEATKACGEVAAQLVLYKEVGDEARQAAATAHKELEEVRQLLEQIRNALSTRETSLREHREIKEATDESLRKHEMDLQKLDIEQTHLLQTVRERFRGLELTRVVGDYHARPAPDSEHRRRIDELTKLIDRMGPVNLDARAEYDDAEKRFEELSTQKIDIETALEKLTTAIRHMDRESKRRFRETFDSVNELFRTTFTTMFKGGRAELRLTEPENLLETGVDIIAQPPGKRLANIELMSGGEKALTATSLIFAIFQHRPSPFCVLDEVDAPLDEANVSRYCEAIRGMTTRSQFILITHIKKTMSEVDVLYGVTMGEPGVSRLVSVKVNEEAKARSDRNATELDEGQQSDDTSASAVA